MSKREIHPRCKRQLFFSRDQQVKFTKENDEILITGITSKFALTMQWDKMHGALLGKEVGSLLPQYGAST